MMFSNGFFDSILLEAILLHELYKKEKNIDEIFSFPLPSSQIPITANCKKILRSLDIDKRFDEDNKNKLKEKLSEIPNLLEKTDYGFNIRLTKCLSKGNICVLISEADEIVTGIKLLNIDKYNALVPNFYGSSIELSKKLYYWVMLSLFNSYLFYYSDIAMFLVFDTSELLSLLFEEESKFMELVKKYLLVKSRLIRKLNEFLRNIGYLDLKILFLLFFHIELVNILVEEGLSRLSFNLYIINIRGKDININTMVPINVSINIDLKEYLSEYCDEEKFMDLLSDFITNWKIVSKLKNTDSPEYLNLLNCFYSLYDFVASEDKAIRSRSLYRFIRELRNCFEKNPNSSYAYYINMFGRLI